jgi:hypothetical protein
MAIFQPEEPRKEKKKSDIDILSEGPGAEL